MDHNIFNTVYFINTEPRNVEMSFSKDYLVNNSCYVHQHDRANVLYTPCFRKKHPLILLAIS